VVSMVIYSGLDRFCTIDVHFGSRRERKARIRQRQAEALQEKQRREAQAQLDADQKRVIALASHCSVLYLPRFEFWFIFNTSSRHTCNPAENLISVVCHLSFSCTLKLLLQLG
jgi:hypothetical protein